MDDRAASITDARTEHDVRLDQHILADDGVVGEENRFRRDHRHAGNHHFVAAALLPETLDRREFRPVVAAGHFHFRGLDGRDPAAQRTGDLDEIRQVVFALDVGCCRSGQADRAPCGR